MVLNKYDILLKKDGNKLTNKIVKMFTKDKYHHSSIYMGDLHIIDAMPNGVKVRNFDCSLGEFDAFRYYEPLNDVQEKMIDEFLQKSLNSKYDFVELILQAFGIRKKKDKKYICISLLMEAFEYAGVEIEDWKVGFKQVSDSKFFKKVNND